MCFPMHDRARGSLLVGDVSVISLDADKCEVASCHLPAGHETGPVTRGKQSGAPTLHLAARTRPKQNQLAIAVPLPGDRVLLLERPSRLYVRRPTAAAVLVRDKEKR